MTAERSVDAPLPQERLEAERRREMAVAENSKSAEPVVQELREAGFPVEYVADLFNRRFNYREAIDILLKWLPLMGNMAVKQDIVRALSVKWARPRAARLLVREFRAAGNGYSSFKWAIGNGLSVVADDSVFDDLVGIAKDKSHGTARQMVAVALGNMRNPRAVEVLLELLEDDEVAGHAIMALRKLNSPRARARVEQFLDHPKTWVRAEARRTLAKIDKSSQSDQRPGSQSDP